jgi:hypothetical protein
MVVFVLIQLFTTTSHYGGICLPFLGAPPEQGHPVFQYTSYGFPIPILTVARKDCFEVQDTTYEWSPIGLGVDSVILILLGYPFWARFRKKQMDEN